MEESISVSRPCLCSAPLQASAVMPAHHSRPSSSTVSKSETNHSLQGTPQSIDIEQLSDTPASDTSSLQPPPPAFTPSPSPSPSELKRDTRHSPYDEIASDDYVHGHADMERSESHISQASGSQLKRAPTSRLKPSASPQLIDHLPLAKDAAMDTFDEIAQNNYHDKKLGRPPGKFDDYMVCDCHPSTIEESLACTDEAGCINRMTQIECSSSRCRFGKLCKNQRFHRRQYAAIDIVQTEKKGFGLRASQSIYKEDFIYEYVGEVMNHTTFLDRMEQYRIEGIRHFYFMMLQPNEYLDATKQGGKARFINHSCNPNCSVSKWQVGKHLRMGIFAKRDIQKGEELTFNYNVDRYGNDAQDCYCGEPNCVGTLGGKTQTDLSGMDDLLLDALGISDEVEQTEAKGSRRKKGKRLDLDFIPQMRPMLEHEATKVMTAARQAGPKREILEKLLRRMEMTSDVDVQKALVKLHGFILMQFLLEQWWNDRDIVLLIINVLARWPLIARNKVIDCGVEEQVRTVADTYRTVKIETEYDAETLIKPANSVDTKAPILSETDRLDGKSPAPDKQVSERADHLLYAWEKLDLTYRIARRDVDAPFERKEGAEIATWVDRRRMQDLDDSLLFEDAKAPNAVSAELGKALKTDQDSRDSSWKPPPMRSTSRPHRGTRGSSYTPTRALADSYTPARLNSSAHSPRTPDQTSSTLSSSLAKSLPGLVSSLHQQSAAPAKSIEDIIREANEQEERVRREADEAVKAGKETELLQSSRGTSPRKRSSSSSNLADKRHKLSSSNAASLSLTDSPSKPSAKRESLASADPHSNEKKLRKAMGDLVVRQMSKHKDKLEKESFKKYAKELASILVAKEMKNPKSWPPAAGASFSEFTEEKRVKIKAFAREYIDKLLARKGKSNGASKSQNRDTANGVASMSTTPASAS